VAARRGSSAGPRRPRALDAGIDLIGATLVEPFDGVVDLAQLGDPAAAEVDGEVVGAEHGATDVAGQRGPQHGVRVEDLAGGGLAAS